jgi:hypothetical protein
MPMLAFLSQSLPPTQEQSREVFAILGRLTPDVKLDRFGWSYGAHDRAFSFVPWIDGTAGPGGNPLLFIDESYDEPTATTLYAGLLLTPGAAFTLSGWYLGNLITLRRQVPQFWPVDAPPPRLHFRELFNKHARQKTTWHTLPDQGIYDFVALVSDALGANEHVHPFVIKIPEAELDKALTGAFPGGVDERAVADMAGQIVGHALRTVVADHTRPGLHINVVIDFDATKIHVGRMREPENVLHVGGRRQSTLRFMEAMNGAPSDPRLIVDGTDRHTSAFPRDFTWARLTAQGYPFTPIVETIGLQFADLFVNIWRHLQLGAYPQLRVSGRILTRAKQTEYFWSPDADGGATRADHLSGST